MKYYPSKIEKKWQKLWEEKNFFKAKDFSKKEKFYLLVEFPYPSGSGLHVGHCRSYIGMDVIARKKRMEGKNVLFPMGWDAFGLPTENYAIKTKTPPEKVTKENTRNFKKQQKRIGLSFDWSREINTTDPNYYKWTQWIFVQLFKKGLSYKAKMPVNWCPSCKIVLANEEVIDGKCERCGAKVIRKEKEQWMLKITKYADRLIDDLKLVDYPKRVKILQEDWIGKSEGGEIEFKIKVENSQKSFSLKVFTTRVDTLFGVTFLVLAPEHKLIEELKDKIKNRKEIEEYVKKAKNKAERERIADEKEKTGIKIKGIKAINPVNGREISIFVADYVLISYGTGAIMGVPSHDQRDFDFAKKYHLPIIEVIKPKKDEKFNGKKVYEGEGILVNSGKFDGLESQKARKEILKELSRKGIARRAVYYKLRDWVFSRQRYWGEPIPMIKCEKCGWVPVPEKDLPVKLPKIKEYQPTEKGDSPLAKVKNWLNVSCPKCGNPAKRETDVMPNWAGSNWYYLRYCDPKNNKEIANKKKLKYWMPVDWYNGGMEHTTLHLLYSRFIYKFLWDIGALPKEIGPEPYKKRTSHGTILAEGGEKMSKSKGNVVNPMEVVEDYGADTLRVYEMFMGPFEQAISWDTKGIKGARHFLEKVWGLAEELKTKKNKKAGNKEMAKKIEVALNKTIKKIGEDIDSLKFNTAISALMEFVNLLLENKEDVSLEVFKNFLKILSPFAPHICEEIWQNLGFKGYCLTQKWPKYKKELVKEKKIILVIQINGKVRDKIEVESEISKEEAKKIALSSQKIKKWIKGNKIKKTIFVPKKLINFVL